MLQTSGAPAITYLYDGDALVAEYDASGTLLRRYVHGPGVDEPLLWYEGSTLTSRRHLRADHQGSVVAVSDASGNSLGVDSYSEYGIKGASNIGRFQYTGQIYLPEVGLNYYKARMHSARWGRFLQVDPIGYEDDLNLYTYVRNDPLNHTDPTGAIADTLVDVGFIAYDIYEFATNPSWTNAGALGADVVGAVVPFATGLGAVVRGVGKGADAARVKGVVYERTN